MSGLGPEHAALLVICFGVSAFNTAIGPIGGLNFAAMATLLPAAAVVPVHAVVEGANDCMRLYVLRGSADLRFAAAFAAGSLLGFAVGWPLLAAFALPERALLLLLGVFILASSWAPFHRLRERGHGLPVGSGAVTSFLTLFVGATGPLVAALLGRRERDHRALLGTHAACMTFQHAGKLPLYSLLGFSFAAFGPLLAALLVANALGVLLGKRVLDRSDGARLRRIMKAVVTLLGLRLVVRALVA